MTVLDSIFSKSLEDKKKESDRIIQKYPSRRPIIVQKDKKCKTLQDIDKNKYLVPCDMTMSEFMYIVRKRINLESSQALFILVNNSLIGSTTQIGHIYEKNKNEDGFLYVQYTGENTFG